MHLIRAFENLLRIEINYCHKLKVRDTRLRKEYIGNSNLYKKSNVFLKKTDGKGLKVK